MYHWHLKKWPIFTFLEPAFLSKIHMAIVYGALGGEALFVTKDKMVYAIGSNDHACLGIGDNLSTVHPRKVEALCDEDIITVVCGRRPHVLALTGTGKVYSWGHNKFSELGNCSTNEGLAPVPIEMKLSNKFVVDIACGSYHSLALTNEGHVYAWGDNKFLQVGKSSLGLTVNTPQRVKWMSGSKKVVSINCCQATSMVITDDGEVYGWGHNNVGQLGVKSANQYLHPDHGLNNVPNLVGITIQKIACGCTHVLALSDKGDLYVWGGNDFGQLGVGNKINGFSPVQLVIEETRRVIDIAATHHSHISVALVEGNRIYIWGSCLSQSILVPTLTRLEYLHDAFAMYSTPQVTYKPIILYDEEEEMSLADCFRQAFDDSTTSDFIVNVQKKHIFVHKVILMIRSEYFRTMFQKNWDDSNQSVLDEYQFSYVVYKAFLKYLYTDEIDLPAENVFGNLIYIF